MHALEPGVVVRVHTRNDSAGAGVRARTALVIAHRPGRITVRRHVRGEGVEWTLPLASPHVLGVEPVGRGRVRRAKLTYLRARSGKAARLALIPEPSPRRRRRRRGAKAKAERRARREQRQRRDPPEGTGQHAVLRPSDPPRVPPRPRAVSRRRPD